MSQVDGVTGFINVTSQNQGNGNGWCIQHIKQADSGIPVPIWKQYGDGTTSSSHEGAFVSSMNWFWQDADKIGEFLAIGRHIVACTGVEALYASRGRSCRVGDQSGQVERCREPKFGVVLLSKSYVSQACITSFLVFTQSMRTCRPLSFLPSTGSEAVSSNVVGQSTVVTLLATR